MKLKNLYKKHNNFFYSILLMQANLYFIRSETTMRKQQSITNKINKNQVIDLDQGMKSIEQQKELIGQVECRVVFLSILDIDTSSEKFSGEIYVEASWAAEIESGEQKSKFNDLSLDWKPKWNPQLRILNSIEDKIVSTWYKVTQVNGSQKIVEIQKIKGTFHEKLELKNYPFDIQHLNIELVSDHLTSKCILIVNQELPSNVLIEHFRDSQEWNLFKYVESKDGLKFTDDFSLQQGEHSMVTFNCVVARKSTYFCWNAFFLIFLITAIGFAIFAIPFTDVGYRIDGSIALILTSVSFKWLINHTLPSIDYLTFADLYSIFGIVFLVVLTCWHAIMGYFYKSWNAPLVDLVALCCLFAIFIIIHVVFLYGYFFFIYKARKKYEMLEQEFKMLNDGSKVSHSL